MMENNNDFHFMNEAEWDRLLKFTSERNTTLVIGDDLIKYQTKTVSDVIKEILIEYLREQCDKQLKEKTLEIGLEIDQITEEQYEKIYKKYGIGKNDCPSLISLSEHHDFFAKSNFGSVEHVIKHIINKLDIDKFEYESLKELLEVDRFNLIISTSFTNIPKDIIQKYSKEKKLRFYYGEIINNTLKINSPDQKGIEPWSGRDDEILFISLMGNEGNKISLDNLIVSEEDIISLVYSWISAINLQSSSVVRKELGKRYLLALGCHIPSWAFRFVWYLIKNPLGVSSNIPSICTRPLPYNENVKKFILRNSALIIDSEKSFAFLNEFTTKWRESNFSKINDYISVDIMPENPDVFVSYASEDRDLIVEKIIPILTELKDEFNIDFWYDKNNIRVGNDWEEEIIYAVEHSNVFLVIQTPNSKKISKDIRIRYLRNEWKTAKTHQQEINDIVSCETEDTKHFNYILPVISTTENDCMAKSLSKYQYIQMNNITFASELKNEIKRMVIENKNYEKLY